VRAGCDRVRRAGDARQHYERHRLEPVPRRELTTVDFRLTVTANADGTWTYDENTRLVLPDRAEPVDHVDRNTLTRMGDPRPNPLAEVVAR
jgi:hypothetical protein